MTENKRFTYDEFEDCIIDNLTGKIRKRTAKRFTYDSKTVSILKDGEFWLDGNIDTACNHSEICNELNKLHEENEQLKQRITELELLNNGLKYALKYIRKIDVEIDVSGDV